MRDASREMKEGDGVGPSGGDVVHVVSTRVANIASVRAALERVGVRVELTADAETVRRSRAVFLPGVGSFASGAAFLDESGLRDALRERIEGGLATCAICLGLQLLGERSDEGAGRGLGVWPVAVERFGGGVRVPQLGWNAVGVNEEGGGAAGWVDDGYAYYANSYCVRDVAGLRRAGWEVASSEHGGAFVAAARRGAVLACQFHPELSGAWGMAVLRGWLRSGGLRVDEGGGRGGEEGEGDAEDAGGSMLGALVAGVTRRVIPCLDVRDGRVVKGVRFQGLRDAGDPVEQALAYQEQGADELVMLDVSATGEGRATAAETVAAIRSVLNIPLTVGGGVGDVDHAARLLDAGADKVSVNTAAVREPELVDRLAARFGSQCTVVAIDAARREGKGGAEEGGWQVVVNAGTRRLDKDAVVWAGEAVERGAGEVLLTSWDRDGTRSGYDTALLRAVSGAVGAPVIASGGAAGAEHLVEALDAGADAVLAASIFHDGEMTVAEVKRRIVESSAHRVRWSAEVRETVGERGGGADARRAVR